jgi:hypothetical protein
MCICIHVCVYIYIYVCMHICVFLCVYVCVKPYLSNGIHTCTQDHASYIGSYSGRFGVQRSGELTRLTVEGDTVWYTFQVMCVCVFLCVCVKIDICKCMCVCVCVVNVLVNLHALPWRETQCGIHLR